MKRSRIIRFLKLFGANRRGGFALVTAIFLPIALICAAIVIDAAMLSLERRKAQGAVDLAAIIAAQNIVVAENAARRVLALNGENTITDTEFGRLGDEEKEKAKTRPRVAVERGRYAPDATLSAGERFISGKTPFNAARVSMSKEGKLYFGARFAKPPTIKVIAIASAQEVAAFSVGSRLAALREGIANDVLGALLGTNVSLSVLDYNALLDADIDAFMFLDALATELDITSGRYKDVLVGDPTLGDVIQAMAAVSDNDGETRAAAAIRKLYSAALDVGHQIDLTTVIDLGPFAELALGEADARGMPAKARVMDLLFANAVVANGETLLKLDHSANVPGLASLTADVSIGEMMQNSPWLRVGMNQEVVSNVQIRAQLVAKLLGEGALNAVTVRAPLYIEVARAEARLGDIRCPGGRADMAEVDIHARPGVVDLWLGEADLSKKVTHSTKVAKAKLIDAVAIKASGKARATVQNMTETQLTFSYNDIASGAIKRTSTTDIFESLFASLVGDLELEVNALGIGLNTGSLLKPVLASTLGEIFGLLDEPVAALLEALGVSVGEADVRVNGVRCDRSVLVQ